jgi:hypothetical protein
MRYRNLCPLILAGLALCAAVAACGSSGSGASGATKSASSVPSPTAVSGSAVTQIKNNWATFFNAKTPAAKRESLLQNGQAFDSVIKAQSGSGLASSVTAKVTKVTVVSPTQAKVTYTIYVAGSPQLRDRPGVAVRENGIWKVGDASFCGLLALQNGGSTSNLPSVCSKTG